MGTSARARFFLLLGFVLAGPSGCAQRYVSTIRGPVIPPGLEVPAASEPDPPVQALLTAAAADAERGGLLANITETIYLVVAGKTAYTVAIAAGKAEVTPGAAVGAKPTLIVPVTAQILANLRAAVADGKLDEGELFNFSYVLFVPCLRRLHGMFYFVEPGNKSSFLVDNFMQFRLKNPSGFTYHGEKVEVAATVLNVDGYFVHLPGLIGDPDVRYEFTVAEALELYDLLIYHTERHRSDTMKLVAIGDRVKGMLAKAATYTRAWH
jgi:hypothetical protein